MTRQRTAIGAAVFGVVAAIAVMAQTPDPRVAVLEQIIGSVSNVKDSTPPLNDSAQVALASAISSLRQAQAAIPPLPPPPGTGTCGEPITEWHAPVVNGCATGHEHGDAPPAWATDFSQSKFGHGVIYGGDEASSAAENGHKHQAFKGITAKSAAGGDVYLRYHAASNPLDRSARYHSYELYYRDTAGNVSFWQGWYDTGDPVRNRVLRRNPALAAENRRPIILVADETSVQQGIGCEQWYAHATGSFSWDLGVTICGATTFYRADENATAMDMSTWALNPSANLGLERRADGFWYPGANKTGEFCATPQGQVVDCMEAGALAQYIAPSASKDAREEFGLKRVSFLVQTRFPGQGVKLPN